MFIIASIKEFSKVRRWWSFKEKNYKLSIIRIKSIKKEIKHIRFIINKFEWLKYLEWWDSKINSSYYNKRL
jgi:hypothetical protein